jgi:two-component system chemotaxis sensor kinase CheA
MQRVDRLFAAIPRMVRDLGRELGKRIDLRMEGGDVEMDREMVEMVLDPLTHIVRNSIDHGIETPAERRTVGKVEAGLLLVTARQSGNQIVIEVRDDGRGVDTDALVRKAINSGALSREAAERLTEEQRLDLIFTPGLTTASAVTAVSGRGVGMDVVRANVERIGGMISLENVRGQGLTITLRVPLTLTIIPGLIITAGGQQFAIPRAAVVEILHANNRTLAIDRIGGASIATIRKLRHSMVDLEDVLQLPKLQQSGPRTIIVIRSSLGVPYVLGVASVENHEELVIRPASPIIMSSGVFAGMTLPDSGRPMLLLDPGGIAKAAKLPAHVEPMIEDVTIEEEGAPVATIPALRFLELTGEERLLQLSLVERVEEVEAHLFGCSAAHPFVRIDGRLLPVVNDQWRFDRSAVTALRLRDGAAEVCYPVSQVLDIVDMPVVPQLHVSRGLVSGVAIVDGVHLEVVDAFALFADRQSACAAEERSTRCFLADRDDPWMQGILHPLLLQAGYSVVMGLDQDSGPALGDVVFCSGDSDVPINALPARVVRLRMTPRPNSDQDSTIYRYDRVALLAAVAAVRAGKAA